MKTEQLQQAFAQLAERVVPIDDPYGRLVRRARHRRNRRLVSVAAAVLALAGVGIASTLVGPSLWRGPGGPGDLGEAHPGFVVASDWGWQLVNSPTRGNLAQDTAFIDEVIEHLNLFSPNSALPHTKTLFADETGGVQRAVVVRYSETHALVESLATPDDFSHTQGGDLIPLEPVIVTDFGSDPSIYPGDAAIALAPPGCAIATSAPISRPGAQRTWSVPVGDRLYFPNTQAPVIRVTCDGVVRQQGPVGLVDDALARSISREDFAGQAAAAYQQVTHAMGLSGAGQMRWSGPLTLGGTSEVNKETRTVYVVGPAGSAAGPLLCYVAGPDPYAFIAQEFIENPAPAIPYVKPFPGSQFSRISTGVAGDSAIALIRIPGQAGDRLGLTDQLLVLVPAGATRIEASEDGAVVGRADVTDGAALVNVRMGSPAVIQAFGPDDTPLASTQLAELTSGNRLFNEPLTADW